jgi:hypothetical protein
MLPQEIGTLAHMRSIILHNNSFYGIIPTEMKYLHELKVLDLGYNTFSGPFPSELRNILSLKFLYVRSSVWHFNLNLVQLHDLNISTLFQLSRRQQTFWQFAN